MEKVYSKLLKQSKGKTEVTAQMVKAHMGLTCSVKCVSRAFWEHGVKFRPQYEKPDLDVEDKKERKAWGEANKHRSASQWNKYARAFMGKKVFQVYASGKFRDMAARRKVRGAYRARRRVFTDGYVKPPDPKGLKQNTGVKSVMIACAIGAGKVLMWHEVKGRWNGAAAAKMYAGPLRRALEKAHPTVRGSWRVLEDNDPTGYKSSKGVAANRSVRIHTDSLPRRIPDLNVLDYSLWHEINQRMRAEEKSFAKGKKESPDEYKARLRRIALTVPRAVVEKAVGDMRRRAQAVVQAGGALFKE